MFSEPVRDSDQSEEGGSVLNQEILSFTEPKKAEWGDQYDLWLIRKAKKKKTVEFLLDFDWKGLTQNKAVKAIPLRIDQNAIQVQAEGSDEVFWIMKKTIVAFKEIEQQGSV